MLLCSLWTAKFLQLRHVMISTAKKILIENPLLQLLGLHIMLLHAALQFFSALWCDSMQLKALTKHYSSSFETLQGRTTFDPHSMHASV